MHHTAQHTVLPRNKGLHTPRTAGGMTHSKNRCASSDDGPQIFFVQRRDARQHPRVLSSTLGSHAHSGHTHTAHRFPLARLAACMQPATVHHTVVLVWACMRACGCSIDRSIDRSVWVVLIIFLDSHMRLFQDG